ncbi:MAG: DUF4214 domain-containing protein [Caulobacteraceae bacterium]|nr:DUF4214 domain-containing protein [Caulobacteraceae bacterium]
MPTVRTSEELSINQTTTFAADLIYEFVAATNTRTVAIFLEAAEFSRPSPSLINYGRLSAYDPSIPPFGISSLINVDSGGFWQNAFIENHGVMQAVSDRGDVRTIWATSWCPSIINTGSISADAVAGESIAVHSFAANLDWLPFSVTNSGSISAVGHRAWGLYVVSGTIQNDGVISAMSGEGSAFGIVTRQATIINSSTGSILADASSPNVRAGAIGFSSVGLNSLLDNEVFNAGLIAGDVAIAEYVDNGSQTRISNTGEIRGDIDLLSGDDVLVNSGRIVGLIDLGEGQDVYDGRGGGRVVGLIDGGGGVDVVRLSGDRQIWSFSQSGGVTTLTSAATGETLQFTEFERFRFSDGLFDAAGAPLAQPELIGSNKNDDIFGTADDDRIFGLSGSDVIDGGVGDDFIDGGEGFDGAVFSGRSTSYRIDDGADRVTVIGRDGTDTVVNVEALAFEDVIVDLGSAEGDDLVGSDDDDVIYGLAGDDLVEGRNGVDLLYGGAGNDVLLAGSGDDRVSGGLGADTIDGGVGYDVAVYVGARAGYETVNSTTVVGGREGGADSLTGIEAAAFVDGLVTFHADSQAAQLMRLYSTAFDREPDALGFHIQLDALESGVTTLTMAERFLASDEFVTRFGALNDIQYIQRLYANALNRSPSNTEINDWLSYLSAGNTRAGLMLVFAESPEHRNLTWSTLSQGLWVGDPVTESLARLYDAAFDRLPDEDGLITWRASLESGMTLSSVATTFLASAEGQAMYGGLSDVEFVTKVYQIALDREPDAGGLAAYVAGLQAGTITRAETLVEISESAEHRALTLPTYVGGIPTETSISAEIAPTIKTGDEDFEAPQIQPRQEVLDRDGDADPQTLPPAGDGMFDVKHADVAQVLPGLVDDAFLPTWFKDGGAQVLPVEQGLDLDALFKPSSEDLVLAKALDLLSSSAIGPLSFEVDDVWRQLPASDAFQ